MYAVQFHVYQRVLCNDDESELRTYIQSVIRRVCHGLTAWETLVYDILNDLDGTCIRARDFDVSEVS